jgi:hypothetical protein
MPLSPSLPDFQSRALAALNAGQTVTVGRSSASRLSGDPARPFAVSTDPLSPRQSLRIVRFPSAPLAVAFLRSL